jgi:RNA polymerase sigma-70 factor (ECF subfamily)
MAVRLALRHRQRARREAPADDEQMMQRISSRDDLAVDLAKGTYRQAFATAFADALHAMPDRASTLLRQHYIDGLTIDELGGLYRVHRSTVARLLARARGSLLAATRALMMQRLDIPASDLDSILRMIRSQIEISLRGLRGSGA